jgi:membrane associated rhomboid family serine protease
VFISLLFSLGSSIDAIAHVGGLLGGLFTGLAVLPGMLEKSVVLTAVGAGSLVAMNLVTFLVFFFTDP